MSKKPVFKKNNDCDCNFEGHDFIIHLIRGGLEAELVQWALLHEEQHKKKELT